ncbi:MAG: 2-C-methyl-D-erythritol 4-phosphate cytidylyltransferase [Oscillospiraceae bacterium]|nr:2-C-methyl-D-erythritol 4-phosphate cytidylyltransferase [Oscillospiraceae bacterium]
MFWNKKTPPRPFVSAVVAAAGAAERMDGIDKQRADLFGMPVVARAIQALDECGLISEIVLVCPVGQVAEYYELVRELGPCRVSMVVEGAATRQASVFAGVEVCSKQAEYIAVHDGARPLVTPEEVEACVEAAFEHDAAALGVRLKDTLKRAGGDGFVAATLNRDETVAIQTPQVFEAATYRQAMKVARCEERTYSDDCQLVERLGKKVYIVNGRYENIKITTPEDLIIARALLGCREGGEAEAFLGGGYDVNA